MRRAARRRTWASCCPPSRPASCILSTDEAAVRNVDRALADAFPQLPSRGRDRQPPCARLEPALAAGLWACRVEMGFPVHPGASTYAYATLAERRGALVRSGRSASLVRSRRRRRRRDRRRPATRLPMPSSWPQDPGRRRSSTRAAHGRPIRLPLGRRGRGRAGPTIRATSSRKRRDRGVEPDIAAELDPARFGSPT